MPAECPATPTVLSFNVRLDTERDGSDRWSERRELVASTVRFHRPDLVGLQEPLAHQYAYLREELPAFAWTGASRRAGEGVGEFTPVGYRRERFERVDAGTFWLSETPDVPGSVGWDAAQPRILTWAHLRDRRADASILFANTHFDHEGERARRAEATLARRRLGALAADAGDDGPVSVVLVGDFNCDDEAEPYRLLVGRDETDADAGPAFRDARNVSRQGHHGPRKTFHGFTGELVDQRDHVFVGDGVDVVRHGTLTDHWGGRYPSDHLPLLADVELPDDGT